MSHINIMFIKIYAMVHVELLLYSCVRIRDLDAEIYQLERNNFYFLDAHSCHVQRIY